MCRLAVAIQHKPRDKESSFSEEKEAKRLLHNAAPAVASKLMRKSFLVLFFKK